MPYPRFATLCAQAQTEINRKVSEMQQKIAQLMDSRNMADAFFACGMSFRIHGNDKESYAADVLKDENALLRYLSDDSIIRPSADKQKLIAVFMQNPSFAHQMFVEGYEYEVRLQNSYDTQQSQASPQPIASTQPSTTTAASAAKPHSSWNAAQWLNEFAAAKNTGRTRPVREKVWISTRNIVMAGSYTSANDVHVSLPLNPNILAETRFYKKEIPQLVASQRYSTLYNVHNGDCLAFAKSLLDGNNTDDLCVLNLASSSNPGGGVVGGAGAQEEYLFRCSDYFRSLFQYKDYCTQYGIPRAADSYPLDYNYGGAFSHGVTIFRDTEATGYALLDKPWHVNFVAAAVARLDAPCQQIPDRILPMVENTIRTILRIAYTNGQRRLVLGAIGCGAFNHPPMHMAQVFKQILHEPEFDGIFKEVHFAIIDDHNARRKGASNIDAFKTVFDDGIAQNQMY